MNIALINRARSTEKSLENQHCWNENMQQNQANSQAMLAKLCANIEAIDTRLALIEEKMSILQMERGEDDIIEGRPTRPRRQS